MARDTVDFKNPVIAAQTFDFPFVPDPIQGHTMPPGREFLGETSHVSIEEALAEIRASGKSVILNVGDSSTSGWDSNIVTENRERHARGEPLLPAFFQYRTYSDCLRKLIGSEYVVLNAGVPAHTSLQGSRRLKLLLDRFKAEQVPISWVTVYYGNNDSVWDHNRQDKEWVGRKNSRTLERARALFKELKSRWAGDDARVITRVLPADYRLHMTEIVETCRAFGSTPIIIEPVTPIYWKPGARVLNEELDRPAYPGSTNVYRLLDESRALWGPAIEQRGYSDLKRAALEEASEKDFVVPRIKRAHVAALRDVVANTSAAYLRVDLDRTEDDIRYFVDYCHPIEPANEMIAEGIADIISGRSAGIHLDRAPVISERTNAATAHEIPTDHYTLY